MTPGDDQERRSCSPGEAVRQVIAYGSDPTEPLPDPDCDVCSGSGWIYDYEHDYISADESDDGQAHSIRWPVWKEPCGCVEFPDVLDDDWPAPGFTVA